MAGRGLREKGRRVCDAEAGSTYGRRYGRAPPMEEAFPSHPPGRSCGVGHCELQHPESPVATATCEQAGPYGSLGNLKVSTVKVTASAVTLVIFSRENRPSSVRTQTK